MKKFVAILLVLASILSLCLVGTAANITFKDVKQDFWGYEAIMAAAEAGLVKGKSTNSDGTANYAPNDTMTRAEFLTTILRLFYKDEAAQAQAGAKWWSGYYDLAKAKGVLKEGELENGNLDKAMTREEMALVLFRTAPTLPAYASVTMATVTAIPDYFSVANVYKEAVLWVYGAELIKGMDDKGTFAPQNSLTRAQSATVLQKLLLSVPGEVDPAIAERQQALVTTAQAYYHKNPYMQYCTATLSRSGNEFGVRQHKEWRAAPEYASEQMDVMAVCTTYIYEIIYHSFGYQLNGKPVLAWTKYLSQGQNMPEEIVMFTHENTGDAAKDKAAMDKVISMVQPGDVLVYSRVDNEIGHTVMYVGDITGDGKYDMLHVNGKNFDMSSGIDNKEANGCVTLSKGDLIFEESHQDYLPKLKTYCLFRPALLDATQYPITEECKTRMEYPGLAISLTVDKGFYGAVVKDEDVTYTLTVKNNSAEDHKALPVTVNLTDTATVAAAEGAAQSGSSLKWDIAAKAGETVVKTFTLKATGKVGSEVHVSGTAGSIALPIIDTTILSWLPDAAKMQDDTIRNKAAAAATDGHNGWIKAYYKEATGKDINLPDMMDMTKVLFDVETFLFTTYYTPKRTYDASQQALADLAVIDYYGGENVKDHHDSRRVLDVRDIDLLPGDVIYVDYNGSDTTPADAWVYDGANFWALEKGSLVKKNIINTMGLHTIDLFYMIRPTAQ